MNKEDKLKQILTNTDIPTELEPKNIAETLLNSSVQNISAEEFLNELKQNSIKLNVFLKALEYFDADEKVIEVIQNNPKMTAQELLTVLEAAKFSENDYARILSIAIKIKNGQIEDFQLDNTQNDSKNSEKNQEIVPKVFEKAFEDNKNKRKKHSIVFKIIASIASVCVIIAGIFVYKEFISNYNGEDNFTYAGKSDDDNYDILFNKVKNFYNLSYSKDKNLAAENSDTTQISDEDGSSKDSFESDTLNQVKNVDEADIIQFDGERFYFVNNNNSSVKILKIDGQELKLENTISPQTENEYYILDLITTDEKLAIIYVTSQLNKIPSEDITIQATDSNTFFNYFNNQVCIDIYDIKNSDFTKPYSTYSQSGSYVDLRVKDNYLYLISKYYPTISGTVNKEEFVKTVPLYAQNGESNYVKPSDIAIPNNINDIAYTIISAVDLNNQQPLSSVKADLSDSENIYASESNIYLAANTYSDNEQKTMLTKISYKDGMIDLKSKELIDGYVNNQYSMDEYNNYFRVVSTTSPYNKDRQTILYVFDENFEKLSSFDSIAVGESVKSVRFDKELAYIVTFLQVDPLFCVDLTDPKNPVLKDELKIPGYSTYLQKWNENLLIGFGVNADENGNTIGLKLSMFDVSESDDLTEKHEFEINNQKVGENTYSIAVSERKALYISSEKNIIGIPYSVSNELATQNKYIFLSYDKEKGFTKLGEVSETGTNAYLRGGLHNEYFYLFSQKSAYVLSSDKFSLLSKVGL